MVQSSASPTSNSTTFNGNNIISSITAATSGTPASSTKKPATILSIRTAPADAAPLVYFGHTFTFVGGLEELLSITIQFGYLDVFTVTVYKLSLTTMTGNLVTLVTSLFHGDYRLTWLALCVITAHSVLGVWLSSTLLTWTNDRRKALFLILLVQSVTLATALILHLVQFRVYKDEFIVALAISQGALFHWASKSGFSTALQTINIQKVSNRFSIIAWQSLGKRLAIAWQPL
jgi:hypothetical protein